MFHRADRTRRGCPAWIEMDAIEQRYPQLAKPVEFIGLLSS